MALVLSTLSYQLISHYQHLQNAQVRGQFNKVEEREGGRKGVKPAIWLRQ